MHEAQMHDENSFVTLTYDDAHLPGPSLVYRDYQLFMRRLRREIFPRKVRFFVAGQYGSLELRPHWHALLFGHAFADAYYWRTSGEGHELSRSATLEKLWPFGACEIGAVTFESAAYVARYVIPKVTGKDSWKHYLDADTGELRAPEMARMSLKPGIGEAWIRKYRSDVNADGEIAVNGRLARIPRYYEQFLSAERQDEVAQSRYEESRVGTEHRTPERLAVREAVTKARLAFKKRSL